VIGGLIMASAVMAAGIEEEACKYLAPVDGEMVMFENDHLHVLTLSRSDAAFEEDLPAGAKVLCLRSAPVPAPGDWKVPAAGHALYLTEDRMNGRTAALEISGGQFRYRLLSGELDESEAQQVRARLAEFQALSR
jgi:hypothetical protein